MKLNEMNPELVVMTDGYEFGLIEVDQNRVREIQVILNFHPCHEYGGPHDIAEHNSKGERTLVAYIPRNGCDDD